MSIPRRQSPIQVARRGSPPAQSPSGLSGDQQNSRTVLEVSPSRSETLLDNRPSLVGSLVSGGPSRAAGDDAELSSFLTMNNSPAPGRVGSKRSSPRPSARAGDPAANQMESTPASVWPSAQVVARADDLSTVAKDAVRNARSLWQGKPAESRITDDTDGKRDSQLGVASPIPAIDEEGFVDSYGVYRCPLSIAKYSRRLARNQPDGMPRSGSVDSHRESSAFSWTVAGGRASAQPKRRIRSSSPPRDFTVEIGKGRSAAIPTSERPWVPGGGPVEELQRYPKSPAPRHVSPGAQGQRRSPVETCEDLYFDAAARKQRHEELKSYIRAKREQGEELAAARAIDQRRQAQSLYKLKDTRTREERDRELLEKKMQRDKAAQAKRQQDEERELQECTFKPNLSFKKTRWRSPNAQRAQGPLQALAERQRKAADDFERLNQEARSLSTTLGELYQQASRRVQQEETQRVSDFLQHGEGYDYLRNRVQELMEQGISDPDQARQKIVEELVLRSQEEVKARVNEEMNQRRRLQESELFIKRLRIVHDLEKIEAQALPYLNNTETHHGFVVGLGQRLKQSLPPAPSSLSMVHSGSGNLSATPGSGTGLGFSRPRSGSPTRSPHDSGSIVGPQVLTSPTGRLGVSPRQQPAPPPMQERVDSWPKIGTPVQTVGPNGTYAAGAPGAHAASAAMLPRANRW